MSRGWIYLIGAVLAEIAWASMLKSTEGFTRLWPSVFCLTYVGLAVFWLSATLKFLPISKAYPIWVGFGGVGVLLYSIVFFHESINAMQVIGICFVIVGAAGLELFKSVDEKEEEEEQS